MSGEVNVSSRLIVETLISADDSIEISRLIARDHDIDIVKLVRVVLEIKLFLRRNLKNRSPIETRKRQVQCMDGQIGAEGAVPGSAETVRSRLFQ